MGEIVRGRFAPSPSGRMHLGNLFSALLAWLSVRRAGGVMVLRMEDLDPDRCRAAYAEQLADDLRWLGLDWDEGYQKGGAHGPYLQSGRTARYAAAFRALEERGLVYPCYCTRAERLAASAPHRSDGQAVYSGKCRHLTAEERTRLGQTRCPAWRLIVPDQEISFTDGLQGLYRENLLRDCGDFILRRSRESAPSPFQTRAFMVSIEVTPFPMQTQRPQTQSPGRPVRACPGGLGPACRNIRRYSAACRRQRMPVRP